MAVEIEGDKSKSSKTDDKEKPSKKGGGRSDADATDDDEEDTSLEDESTDDDDDESLEDESDDEDDDEPKGRRGLKRARQLRRRDQEYRSLTKALERFGGKWDAKSGRLTMKSGKPKTGQQPQRRQTQDDDGEADALRSENADLSGQVEKMESQLNLSKAKDTVMASLMSGTGKFQAKNFNTARKIWRYVADEVDADEDGEVDNLSALLRECKAEFPEYFIARRKKSEKNGDEEKETGSRKKGSVDGGKGSRGKAGGFDMNSLIRRGTGRSTAS